MKKYIKKIKDGKEDHKNKAVIIFAGVTTLVVVIIWLVLTSIFRSEPEVVELQESQAPGLNDLIEEASVRFQEVNESLQETNESLGGTFDEIEAFEQLTPDQQRTLIESLDQGGAEVPLSPQEDTTLTTQ